MAAQERRFTRYFDAMLSAFARAGRASFSYLGLAIAAPVLAASVYWYWVGPEGRLKYLDTNKVSVEDQHAAARYGISTLIVLAALLPAVHFAWTNRRGISFAAFASRVGTYFTPLLAVPFIVAIAQKNLEKESPKLTLFFCALIGAIIGVSTYRIASFPRVEFEDAKRQRTFEWVSRVAAVASIGAMWAGYAWFFTNLSITNHHAMGTRTIDLGLYDNIFWQSAHGSPLSCSLIKAGYHGSAHFDPILVVLSPLYRFYPRVEFILGLQSVWCGSGVVPVYLIARRQLGSRLLGVLIAACYAMHPALHGANMYEFHSLTLAGVPLLWTLWALQTGRLKLYWVFVFISMLVREDIPLMLVPVGLACILRSDGKLRRVGFITIIAGLAYFGIVKKFFMTSGDVIMSGAQSYSYGYYYVDMIPGGKGISGMFLTVLANPTYTLRHAMEEPKLVYMAIIFMPVAFMPFFAKSWRLTLLYGIAFTTLASRTAVFSPAFQYSTALLPFVFAALPIGITDFAESRFATAYGLVDVRLRRAFVFAAFAASMATTYKFGAFVENQYFHGGFVRVVRKLTPEQKAHYEWLEAAKKQIPPKASVGVTQKIGPHVSNRKDVYLYGQHNVQYVFVDEREIKGNTLKRHKKAVDDGSLEVVTKRGSYALYKVGRPKPKPKPEPNPDDDEEQQPEDARDVLGDEPQE